MFRIILIASLLTVCIHGSIAFGQDHASNDSRNWVSFRGNGNSLSTAANLPTKWDDKANIDWTLDLPGYGQSSPVIWGDRVYTTTMQGDMKEMPTTFCVSLESGNVIWKKEFKATQEIKASDYVTRSSPTPAVDDQHVYSFFESGELIATDHEGATKWKRSLVEDYGQFKGNHGIGSSIALGDDAVFVLVAHEGPSYLLAVDKKSGKNVWKTDLPEKVSWSSPVVAGEQIIVSVSGTVQSYDVATGKQIWSIDDVKGNTVASATVKDDVAYIGSSERSNNFAIRFDPTGKSDSAKIIWRNDEVTSSFGSPLVQNESVYFVNKQGVAHSVDAKTGKTQWKQRLSGSCWASPIGTPENIYFFTKDGITDILSQDPEPKIVASNTLSVKDRIYGVAVSDARFVVRTGTRLVCIKNGTAAPSKLQAEDKVVSIADFPVMTTSFGAAVCNGHLYVYGGNMANAHTYSSEGQNNIFRRIKLQPGSNWEDLGEVPRRQGNALVAHGDKVYRIGGFEAKNSAGEDENIVSTTDFSVYDPATAKWTDMAPLPEPRSSFDAVVSGNVLYVVGGWALGGDSDDVEWHGTAWQMDLSQEQPKWQSMPAPPYERRANSLAEQNDKIYLIGGMADNGQPTTNVFCFDKKTKKWSDGPELPGQPMDGFGTSSFNVGGQIVVETFSGQVLMLSEDGKSWKKLESLKEGRFFHRLVAIGDKQFAIIGGTSPKAKQRSVMVLERE